MFQLMSTFAICSKKHEEILKYNQNKNCTIIFVAT